MTEKIQSIIEQIKLKGKELHFQLEEERGVVRSITSELSEVKAEKDNLILEVKNLNLICDRLKDEKSQVESDLKSIKNELETMKEESVKLVQIEEKTQNVQIEELVREIEYCINQLKK